jgi:hypothetical protein
MQETTIISQWNFEISKGKWAIIYIWIIVISYHNNIVPAISYHSENHFVPYADRYIMNISYHMQIDTLWPFRTICRSIHYDHFVPYADRYIMTISYHMQIDTLWPFRTICRSIHYDQFVSYADRYIMTISYHMQIDTLWPFRIICRSIHYDHFVYAKSYADSTFSLIVHHIQINAMPTYMLHVGIVKSMHLKRTKKNIHIINFIKCSVISTLLLYLFIIYYFI